MISKVPHSSGKASLPDPSRSMPLKVDVAQMYPECDDVRDPREKTYDHRGRFQGS